MSMNYPDGFDGRPYRVRDSGSSNDVNFENDGTRDETIVCRRDINGDDGRHDPYRRSNQDSRSGSSINNRNCFATRRITHDDTDWNENVAGNSLLFSGTGHTYASSAKAGGSNDSESLDFDQFMKRLNENQQQQQQNKRQRTSTFETSSSSFFVGVGTRHSSTMFYSPALVPIVTNATKLDDLSLVNKSE